MAPDGDILEALRPKSVQELHAAVAAGKPRAVPPIVNQLQDFVLQQQLCEERCKSRLRDRAAYEAKLLPYADHADLPGGTGLQRTTTPGQNLKDDARGHVIKAVHGRFAALDGQCDVLCGRRLAHLVGGS
ncbi:unnamed protein product [Symbiodinium pilosum]|uniref:Uncharacterized protein n=1 Tax=Symbiodinium pilosum TaxID=2952 RepID=A0A812QJF9_SYMPI|nr:unnamed protein product [Symbiodinium pilosum]